MNTINERYLRWLHTTTLEELYSAETQLAEVLPEIKDNSTNPTLQARLLKDKNRLENRIQTVRTHILQNPETSVELAECKAITGLIHEWQEAAKSDEASANDLQIIIGGNRVKHCTIAVLETARMTARALEEYELSANLETWTASDKAMAETMVELAEQQIMYTHAN